VTHREQIYIAPSGVQKERIQVSVVFTAARKTRLPTNDPIQHRGMCLVWHIFLKKIVFPVRICVAQPDDLFVCDMEERDVSCPPAWKHLRRSQCTPLFMNAYRMRGESPMHVTRIPAAGLAISSISYQEFSPSLTQTNRCNRIIMTFLWWSTHVVIWEAEWIKRPVTECCAASFYHLKVCMPRKRK